MKKIIPIIALILFVALGLNAQQPRKTEEIKIKTSAQCGQCKTRIETAMAYEKGVVKSKLDVDSKVLTVTYKVGKTTPEAIRKAVAAVGYDADDVLADPKAYKSLPPCCKKPDDPEHVGH